MKVKWLLAIVLILGGITMYVMKKDAGSTIDNGDWDVAVPIAKIQKIFLADRAGNTISFAKKDGDWWLQDSIPVRQNAIQNLLYTIENLTLKFRPSQAALDVMVKSIASRGVKVEVYGASDLLSTFYVGGMTNDERGTYIMKEEGNQPYVMHVPGHVGGLRSRFSTKLADWRSLELLDIPAASIRSVSVDYPGQKSEGFTLVEDNVKPLHQGVILPQKQVLPKKIKAYKHYFQSIGAEYYFDDPGIADSLRQATPFCQLDIITTEAHLEWTFYPIAKKANQVDRLYAINEKGATYLVQVRNFQPLFRSFSWFYES